MIGIQAIGSYIPEAHIDNRDHLEKFSTSETFLEEKLGIFKVARKADSEETSDMCVRAFEALQSKTGLDVSDIDCIVVCTQNPDAQGLPHTSALVHARLGAKEDCACFDISLGCSGYVYGLNLITHFMQGNGFRRGILFTADPYSKILDDNDKNTSLLFGDAAAATLVSDQPIWQLVDTMMATRGSGASALFNDNGTLKMNGRAVFNFAIKTVPPQVNRLLERNRLGLDDVDLFLMHQGSYYMVHQLRKVLGGIAPERMPFDVLEVGNTVSSTIPLLAEQRIFSPGPNRLLMSGFGVGLSWATSIYTRVAV